MRIYIMSPFFSDEEFERVTKMEKFLEDRGYEVYSPKRDGIMLTPDATQEDRLNVFEENVREVYKADLCIGIVATPDTGTSFEFGTKYSQWKSERDSILTLEKDDPEILTSRDKILIDQEVPRIITFSDNGKKLNVMLLGAVLCHCNTWEELSSYLDYVDEVGIDKAKRNTDSIMNTKVF